MDVTKIYRPDGKRVDISEYGEPGDFITVKIFPITERAKIYQEAYQANESKRLIEILKSKNISPEEYASKKMKLSDALTADEVREVMSETKLGKDLEYKFLVLLNGVDPKNHSFVDEKGNKITLNRKFWENLGTYYERLFNHIVAEVSNYQAEFSLGEYSGKEINQ